jgi:hypothetical protein
VHSVEAGLGPARLIADGALVQHRLDVLAPDAAAISLDLA